MALLCRLALSRALRISASKPILASEQFKAFVAQKAKLSVSTPRETSSPVWGSKKFTQKQRNAKVRPEISEFGKRSSNVWVSKMVLVVPRRHRHLWSRLCLPQLSVPWKDQEALRKHKDSLGQCKSHRLMEAKGMTRASAGGLPIYLPMAMRKGTDLTRCKVKPWQNNHLG